MSEQFQYLFAPLKIGSMTVKSRLLVTPHGTGFGDDDGLFNERDCYYLAERAKGGAGLVTTGATAVHPTGQVMGRHANRGYKREQIPRYRMMADMVHEHNGRVLVELNHCGHMADGGVQENWQQVWCPSPIPAGPFHVVPKEMTRDDIKEVVEGFALCARIAQEGGVDGVELHGATGYLLHQFMSPLINRRTDEYGGNTENRLRIVFEIVKRIREECGRDFVLGVRICADDLAPGGITLEDGKEHARLIEANGGLDFIDVNAGSYLVTHLQTASMPTPHGFLVPLASAIKQATQHIPVFCVGRIVDPVHAEKILGEGHADMIGMTRAHIADPEIGNKAREGLLEDIRKCVGCNTGCMQRAHQGRQITCIQNVAAGREKELGIGTLKPASVRKRVMVIGGGVAGMEAARVAALRGHQVSLYERGTELGGQVNIAARGPTRQEFGEIARYLTVQMGRVGVDVHLNSEASADAVKKAAPDAVVVAVGSTPLRSGFSAGRLDQLGIPGCEQENVLTAVDVLLQKKPVGNKVVVIDDDAHQIGASAIEFLAEQGKQVEVVTRLLYVGQDLVAQDLVPAYQRQLKKGVVYTPNTLVKAIEGNSVVVYNGYTGVERRIDGVDTVVLAMGSAPNNELAKALKGTVKELYEVGDCVHPRRVANAIWEGHQAGRAL